MKLGNVSHILPENLLLSQIKNIRFQKYFVFLRLFFSFSLRLCVKILRLFSFSLRLCIFASLR